MLPAAVALALTPMVMFLGGVINPNGMEIAAALCVWLTLLAITDRLGDGASVSTRLAVRLAVSASLLAVARPLSPAILIGVVVVVALLRVDRSVLRAFRADRRLIVASGVVGLVVLASAGFVVAVHSLDSLVGFPLATDHSALWRAGFSIERSGDLLREEVGKFGFVLIPLPDWVVWLWVAAVAGVAALALAVGRWRERLVFLALLVGCLALPVVSDTLTAQRLGFSWQGRYGLPLLVGVPIVAGWIIDRSGRLSARAARRIGLAAVGVVVVGYEVACLVMLRRNLVGISHPLLDGLTRGTWRGPLTPILLFAWTSVATAAWAAVVLWAQGWRLPGGGGRSRAEEAEAVEVGDQPAGVTTSP